MKILQTPPRYAPDIGGVQVVAQQIAERLQKRGHSVEVLCADEPRGAPSQVNGVRVKRLWWPFKIANTNITPGLPIALLRSNWDLVHTHLPTPWSADWSCLVARVRGKPCVITYHNGISGSGIANWIARFYNAVVLPFTLRLADRVIVLSTVWEEQLKSRFPATAVKIQRIPNAVDLSRFSPGNPFRRRDSLLFVGVLDAFHTFKGLDVLLHALAIERTARLQVVGDGELRTFYQRMALDLGVADRTQFLGAVSGDRLVGLYRDSAIFVLPSNLPGREGAPLVVLEAMACGVPVIVAEAAGDVAWDVEKSGAGLRVSANDPKSLAEAIRSLISDEKLREEMGRRAREHVAAHHSLESIVDRTIAVYSQALRSRSAPAQRFRREKSREPKVDPVRAVRIPNCYLCGTSGGVTYEQLRDRHFEAPGTWNFLECPSCGLYWLDPRPLPEETRKLYTDYQTHVAPEAPSPLRVYVRDAILDAAYRYRDPVPTRRRGLVGKALSLIGPLRDAAGGGVLWLGASERGRLLDVGCGNGQFLARMRRLGWEVTGVEPDPVAVRVGRDSFGLNIISGTLEQAGLPGAAFDFITMNHVIEHLPDPIETLKECKRVARPGGRIVVLTPNAQSLGRKWFRVSWRDWDIPRHLFLFNPQTLRMCAEQVGLSVDEIRTTAKEGPFVWQASYLLRRDGALPGGRPGRVSWGLYARGVLFWLLEDILRRFRPVGEELVLLATNKG